jgi:hypothetical protein
MKAFCTVVFLFFWLQSFSQDSTKAASVSNDEVNILYRNEAEGGLNVHGSGFGLTFKRGWHMTGYKKQMLDIEFVSLRHPKQIKRANPYYQDSKPFFFGKLNFAYLLRGGYGRQNILFSKGERSGVEVRYNYYIGATLGITKPVFLDVLVDSPYDSLHKVVETRKYDPDDPDQQDPVNIFRPGPYFQGLDQLNIYPGGYAKFAISFEYSGWQQKVTALEAGVVVDAFPKAIPIMAFIPNDKVIFNFYISLMWGGKW